MLPRALTNVPQIQLTNRVVGMQVAHLMMSTVPTEVSADSACEPSGGFASSATAAPHGACGCPTSTKIPCVCLDGRIELLDSDHPILDEALSETSEGETMPEIYEIAGSVPNNVNRMRLRSTGNRTKLNVR